jgi:orotate phosphoribosyltransferase
MAHPGSAFPLVPPPADAARHLVALLAERSARRGHFTLSSGRTSTLYVDARKTTMSPDGLALIGPLGLATVRATGWTVDAVGGLTLGADPVAYAIAYASALAAAGDGPPPVRAFTVRKAPKTHGTAQLIEGPFETGDRVVVVEDVITTGGSALRAVEAVRAAGGTVVGVLAVVDREEGGREAIEAGAGVPVIALTQAADVIALL